MKFRIACDSCCDLPSSYANENNLAVFPLSFTVDGKTSLGTLESGDNCHDFYEATRSGIMPSTSLINPETFIDGISPILEGGEDVLLIDFSSGLSGTAQSAKIAAEELRQKFPKRKLLLVDSLCASLGYGLLLYYVIEKAKSGATIEETCEYAEKLKLNIVHMFTVDSLHYLQRGGRVSKIVAVVGTMLSIKPVLHVDNDGHLIPVMNVRGRKKSLDALVSAMGEKIRGFDNPVCFISHGDCIDDAVYVKEQVEAKYGIKEFKINYVGPVIGSHSGPGTVALFFVGNPR